MSDAYIIDACRTPRGIGKVGKGSLAHLHPQHLARTVLAALAERNNLKTDEVDDVIWGTSSQRGAQGGDMGRMADDIDDAAEVVVLPPQQNRPGMQADAQLRRGQHADDAAAQPVDRTA